MTVFGMLFGNEWLALVPDPFFGPRQKPRRRRGWGREGSRAIFWSAVASFGKRKSSELYPMMGSKQAQKKRGEQGGIGQQRLCPLFFLALEYMTMLLLPWLSVLRARFVSYYDGNGSSVVCVAYKGWRGACCYIYKCVRCCRNEP